MRMSEIFKAFRETPLDGLEVIARGRHGGLFKELGLLDPLHIRKPCWDRPLGRQSWRQEVIEAEGFSAALLRHHNRRSCLLKIDLIEIVQAPKLPFIGRGV